MGFPLDMKINLVVGSLIMKYICINCKIIKSLHVFLIKYIKNYGHKNNFTSESDVHL